MKKFLLLVVFCAGVFMAYSQHTELRKQVFEACEQGNVAEVKNLIEKGADISTNENDSTYLVLLYLLNTIEKPELVSFAKSLKEDEVFEILLCATEHGFNVFEQCSAKIPCVAEQWDESSWLWVQVVDPDCISIGYNPYFLIVESGRFHDFEQAIIQNINSGKYSMQSNYGSTPLHIACEAANSVAVVDALIKNGADVNAVDSTGVTPLLQCMSPDEFKCELCRIDQLEIIKLLLQSGANVNIYKDAYTSLAYSFFEDQYEIAKLLIENGADLSNKEFIYNDSTRSPSAMMYLLWKAFGNCRFNYEILCETDSLEREIVWDLLLTATQHGFNVFETFSAQLPCVEERYEPESNNYQQVTIPNCITSSYTPYFNITEQGRFKDFEQAIINNINAGIFPKLTSTGSTPLNVACEAANSLAVVDALIKNGADVNAFDSDGCTPLINCVRTSIFDWDSCRVDKLKIARLLIKSGANVNYLIPNEYDYAGHSSLLYASLSKDYALSKLLIENGADVDGNEQEINDSTRIPSAMFFLLMSVAGNCPVGFEYLAVTDSVDKMQVYELLSMSVSRGFNVFEPIQGSITTVETFYDTIYSYYYQQYKNISVEYLPYAIIANDNILTQFEKVILKQIKQKKYTGTDSYGNSALHYACAYGNSVNIVKAVLKSGADIYATNKNGETPADLAKENGNIEVYNFISGKMK
ncbi:MAG TPA: ankyrin repeat domain-containing protein [Bacteroidales bacterium]|nr:ankyrin repeat domain-containing protein [Bacteroidales bacterium]